MTDQIRGVGEGAECHDAIIPKPSFVPKSFRHHRSAGYLLDDRVSPFLHRGILLPPENEGLSRSSKTGIEIRCTSNQPRRNHDKSTIHHRRPPRIAVRR